MINAIKNFFSTEEEQPERKDVEIVEDVSGTWSYHLKRPEDSKALCGRRTMNTSIAGWGSKAPSHLPASYCSECEEIAANQNLNL